MREHTADWPHNAARAPDLSTLLQNRDQAPHGAYYGDGQVNVVKILLGLYALALTLLSLILTLYIKELKLRVADRDIRIKRYQGWLSNSDDASLTNPPV